jgi:glycosyltransferase involved in cell wall biosynthesis
MKDILLTIAIPTFNRSESLELLLNILSHELADHTSDIEIIISDNASTDDTENILESFYKQNPSVKIIRHFSNIGMDLNFCECFEHAEGRFFWMIGDDDIPKPNTINQLLFLLKHNEVDILYLSSEWTPNISSSNDGTPIKEIEIKTFSRLEFVRRVNIWITFISGMIINRERLRTLNPSLNYSKFKGTYLVHLGWTLPLLMSGKYFHIVYQPCILATAANSGGYKLFEVFGTNLPFILSSIFGEDSPERKLVINSLAWGYLPTLLWNNRLRKFNSFNSENIFASIQPVRSSAAYHIFMIPILFFPRPFAFLFVVTSKVLTKLYNIYLRLRF